MTFLASVAAATFVFMLSFWYLRSRNVQDERVRTLGARQRIIVDRQSPFSQRVAFPVFDGLVSSFMRILPTTLIGRARKGLIIAGDGVSLSQFFAVVLVASTALPGVLFVLFWAKSGGAPPGWSLLVVLGAAVLGLIAPFLVLRRVSKRRQRLVWKSLPNAIDLMTTCVEAGLSLDFALQRVAERYKGPLAEEIHRMLRETGLGKPRRDALVAMAERVDLPDLLTFVNSIVQAEALGTSVGQVLRVQAAQMRVRRRQRAEQVARQAPVKMVFPLVFCLMPSLFIVTIGPVILNLARAISHSH